MKLTLELSTSQLIPDAGYAQPVTSLHQSYGEGSRIEITCLREGVLVTPTELEQFAWVVKPVGFFKTEKILAGTSDFTWDSDLKLWVGHCNYNVAALTAQLHQASTSRDEQDSLMLWSQLAWRTSSSAPWQRSQIITAFRLDNALWKGDEVMPSTGTPVESNNGAYLRPAIASITADVVNSTTSYADITGLRFAVQAGKRYWFRFVIPHAMAATGTGKALSITGPATPTELWYRSIYQTTTGQTTNEGLADYDQPAAANASSLATTGIATIEGFVKPSASGFITARFKTGSGANPITAKAGANVQWAELAA